MLGLIRLDLRDSLEREHLSESSLNMVHIFSVGN